VAVIGQEGFDAPIGNQLATQRHRIEELTVGFAMALHQPILDDRCLNREHLFSTGS
jgi:hypothetical protein